MRTTSSLASHDFWCLEAPIAWWSWCNKRQSDSHLRGHMLKKLWRYVKPFPYNTGVWHTDGRMDRIPISHQLYCCVIKKIYASTTRGSRIATYDAVLNAEPKLVLNIRSLDENFHDRSTRDDQQAHEYLRTNGLHSNVWFHVTILATIISDSNANPNPRSYLPNFACFKRQLS